MAAPAAASKTRAEDTSSVARWKDSVKRELRTFENHQAGKAPRPFHVNPRNLQCVTRKIGALPLLAADSAAERRELFDLLHRTQKPPRDVLKRPATASQEYGWHSRTSAPDPFSMPLARSAEVRFADAYAKSFHVGPYGKTQPMAR